MFWGTGKGFIILRLWNFCRRLSVLKLGFNVFTGLLVFFFFFGWEFYAVEVFYKVYTF